MKLWINFLLLLLLSLASCGTRKSVPASGVDATAAQVVDNAFDFLGTPYRYGGTTSRGMDCSWLLYTAFLMEGISLPRQSADLARLGYKLSLKQVQPGDLLFFWTGKSRARINHVGLVVRLEKDQIFFIHASSSNGVMVSELDHLYWMDHFVMARRVL